MPMERATISLWGAVYSSSGVPACTTSPSSMITIESAMA